LHHNVLHYIINLRRNFQIFWASIAFDNNCFTFHSKIHNTSKFFNKKWKTKTKTNKRHVIITSLKITSLKSNTKNRIHRYLQMKFGKVVLIIALSFEGYESLHFNWSRKIGNSKLARMNFGTTCVLTKSQQWTLYLSI